MSTSSKKNNVYKTVILLVVLYGCETWTLTLREEQRLRVFENKVLRKVSGAKRDAVTGEWRKLHNAELHALYSSPDIIRDIKSRRLRWAGHVARKGEFRNAYRLICFLGHVRMSAPKVTLIADPVTLGEGPHWDHDSQALYYVNVRGSTVNKYVPATKKHTTVKIEGGPVSIVIPVEGTNDKFVITVGRNVAIMTWDGESDTPADVKHVCTVDTEQSQDTRLNDGKADPTGRLWAGTMCSDTEFPQKIIPELGAMYSFSKDWKATKHLRKITVSNGFAWTEDLKIMYYIDSTTRKVHAFDFDVENGKISNKRTAFDYETNNVEGIPDGMAIDTEGKLWVACFEGSKVMENTEILLEASKAIGLEVNPEKTKYMIMPRDQNIVRNGNIKVGDLSFEGVEKFKYLGATVTNINDTREEIKHRINMGNACYYSVEKLLSSSLLSKNLKVRIYKTVILPVLLYGCETWTLTLREEHRLRVFENKALRKIFGAKRDEVTGEWRKLHNAELHALYSSPDVIRNIKSRRLRWAGHVARMGESRNAYSVLVGRPEGKRPLGRPRRRWEDNIKMYLREVGYDDRDWINLAQDRDRWRAYVRAAMNLRVIRIDPMTGKLLLEIEIPAPQVTSVTFGGPQLDELYVTSANLNQSEELQKKYPLSGATFHVTGIGAKGYPGQPVKL
ncbi:hypothetical protein ANN_12429 [Periplaneta americana]|uniref:SMP-30/Gluconolactonase/LRE-like region domain-containing protein n=1 Tax=Periplaneta americana TaxID=6978 RepID=A0ABQ8TIQ3_PERAM|nr:hypothetical protein ANN_12429 [Periplaneta americana]